MHWTLMEGNYGVCCEQQIYSRTAKKQENQGVTKWPSQGLDLNLTLKWFGRTLRKLCVNKRMQTLTNQSNTVKRSKSYTIVCDTDKVIDARSTIYLTLACM